jgi:hypothetical protein
MPTTLINKPMKNTCAAVDVSVQHMSYEEVSRRTTIALKEKGWCCWQCATLDNEIIVIVRDEEVSGYPAGHPVYTERELKDLALMNASGMRLIQEAKKMNEVGN